jgi:hypothetical protein
MKAYTTKVQKPSHFGRKGKVGVLQDLVSSVPSIFMITKLE